MIRLAFRALQLVLAALLITALPNFANAQAPDTAAVLKSVDASVARREADLAGYTAIEHYAVFRSSDAAHAIAEMTVKTTYRKDSGKSYEILSETGSSILRKEVLERMLDNERDLTRPAVRVHALIDTSNYKMKVGSKDLIDERPCVVLDITPRHAETYLFKGKLWVDARDGSIVQLEGATAKPASILAGPTQVSRRYTMIDGYPMATQATANTSVVLVGQMRIVIDYSAYSLQTAPAAAQSAASAPVK